MSLPPFHLKSLRLIVTLNVLCLLLIITLSWTSSRKAEATAATREKYQPLEIKVRDLIETETDIVKLRELARSQFIGASGSTEAMLGIQRKSATMMLPFVAVPLSSILIAGLCLVRSRKSGVADVTLSSPPAGCL